MGIVNIQAKHLLKGGPVLAGNKKKADGIEVFENLVEKIVSPYCGFVIKNPIINF